MGLELERLLGEQQLTAGSFSVQLGDGGGEL